MRALCEDSEGKDRMSPERVTQLGAESTPRCNMLCLCPMFVLECTSPVPTGSRSCLNTTPESLCSLHQTPTSIASSSTSSSLIPVVVKLRVPAVVKLRAPWPCQSQVRNTMTMTMRLNQAFVAARSKSRRSYTAPSLLCRMGRTCSYPHASLLHKLGHHKWHICITDHRWQIAEPDCQPFRFDPFHYRSPYASRETAPIAS
jgi:hypothetical protein